MHQKVVKELLAKLVKPSTELTPEDEFQIGLRIPAIFHAMRNSSLEESAERELERKIVARIASEDIIVPKDYEHYLDTPPMPAFYKTANPIAEQLVTS